MYHLFNQEDKNKAIAETIRVCKPNGICMFAFLTHSSIVWNFGVRKNKMSELAPYLNSKGVIKDTPEEVFASYHIEDFAKQFENSNTTHIVNVATDGLFSIMRDYIDNVMSEEDYKQLINWHFNTCERLDQQGNSSHMLYICKKN